MMNSEPSGFQAAAIFSALQKEAMEGGPQDSLSRSAFVIRGVCGLLFAPTILLIPAVTMVLGLLVMVTFGLLLLPLSMLWILFLAPILGSSWLWINCPIARIFILVPGIIIATIGSVYASFVPDMGEKYQKVLKIGLADSWPYSFLVWKLSSQVCTDVD